MSRLSPNVMLGMSPYFIDDMQVIPIDDVVIRHGEEIKVPTRAIQALAYFITHAGEVVTYEQINNAIWSGKFSENAFYQLIALLRKTLGDNSKQPKYIKTIAKQGYVFIGSDSVKPNLSTASEDEVSQCENQFKWQWQVPVTVLLVVVMLAATVALLKTTWFSAEEDPDAALYALVDHLQLPQSTVIVERLEVHKGSETNRTRLQAVNNGLVLLSQYHLSFTSGQHVAVTPKFENSALGVGDSFYKKLQAHYSDTGGISYILRPQVALGDSGEWLFSLIQISAETQEQRLVFEFSSAPEDIPEAIVRFEAQLLDQLRQLSLLTDKSTPLFDLPIGVEEWLGAAENSFLFKNTREGLERIIRLTQSAIDANPKNLLAYAMLWTEMTKLISTQNDLDLDAAFQLLDSSIIKAEKVDPDYYWTALISACRYCWLGDQAACASHYFKALELHPGDPILLHRIYWSVADRPDLQLPLAKHNYALNPFDHDAFANYRLALIGTGDFHALAELVDYHSEWSDSKNWFVQVQSQTTMDLLQRQADDYRSDNFVDINGQLLDVPLEVLPSRYSGYAMLNANRPDLARFWLQNGMERELLYFDLSVIELLADIWQGQWQPQKWQIARAGVMERRQYQNTLDKLIIAYLDRQTGWLIKSAEMLMDLYPALANEEAVIDEGNLRFFVYYSDIQKRLGNYKYANETTRKIKLYLQQRPAQQRRGIDFGIADIEFYALNYNHDKALDLLEEAVYRQGWLPNALWLWPPLERNQFLNSLHNNARFNAMVEYIHRKLESLCLDGCS